MNRKKVERRLAAILIADIVGYSRLVGADELGTLTTVRALRREFLDPAFRGHRGRIVRNLGDGLLVEFASVVDAVACAVAIQRGIITRNAAVREERCIVLRIGINVGDIIIDGGDVFGDGVNVAARLEALCEPGGLCISRSANDQIHDKISLSFADLGEHMVKNIARSVGVFGLTAEDIARLPENESPWEEVGPDYPQDAPSEFPPDRRMSLVVLPFENGSGDPMQDALAAGFTHDVTDRFARAKGMSLVSAATAATYRARSATTREIGRELDVHFALTGSLRRQGDHLIVTWALNETSEDRAIWSQRLEERLDEAADRAGTLYCIYRGAFRAMVNAEAYRARGKRPEDFDARDCYLASRTTSLEQSTKEGLDARVALLDRALVLDPDFSDALAEVALLRIIRVKNDCSETPAIDLAFATDAITRLSFEHPHGLSILALKAWLSDAKGDLDQALELRRAMLEVDPEAPDTFRHIGEMLLHQGHDQGALENLLEAQKRIPIQETDSFLNTLISLACLSTGRFAESISMARLALGRCIAHEEEAAEIPRLVLIAAKSLSGMDSEAAVDLERHLTSARGFRTLADVRGSTVLAKHRLVEGLRKAGRLCENSCRGIPARREV